MATASVGAGFDGNAWRFRGLAYRFVCVSMLLLLSAAAHAGKVTNSKFLELTEAQQHWWFLGAFGALGHVAFIEDKEKGGCVWNWMYEDGRDGKKILLDAMKQFPEHTPTSILIATLRRDCGVFLKTE